MKLVIYGDFNCPYSERLGLTGRERYDISGLAALGSGDIPEHLTVRADDKEFPMHPRIDTTQEAAYYRHGGIPPYVLRQLAGEGS
jgi:aconitate hydratase